MSKSYVLSAEERRILEHLATEQLQFLSKIKDDKEYQTFIDSVNLLIDLEKNLFFAEDESKYTESVWQARHAYARGRVAGFALLLHVIFGASGELTKRQNRKKGENA